jgi:CheY-like chemotaxis protein
VFREEVHGEGNCSERKQHLQAEREQSAMKTILAVEDDADFGAFLVEAILGETAYEVVLVSESQAALHVCKDIKPDLFLFNYNVPGMNGIELADHLHAREGLEHVPTIITSARLPRQEINQRGLVGLEKPLDLDTFLKTIEYLLS